MPKPINDLNTPEQLRNVRISKREINGKPSMLVTFREIPGMEFHVFADGVNNRPDDKFPPKIVTVVAQGDNRANLDDYLSRGRYNYDSPDARIGESGKVFLFGREKRTLEDSEPLVRLDEIESDSEDASLASELLDQRMMDPLWVASDGYESALHVYAAIMDHPVGREFMEKYANDESGINRRAPEHVVHAARVASSNHCGIDPQDKDQERTIRMVVEAAWSTAHPLIDDESELVDLPVGSLVEDANGRTVQKQNRLEGGLIGTPFHVQWSKLPLPVTVLRLGKTARG